MSTNCGLGLHHQWHVFKEPKTCKCFSYKKHCLVFLDVVGIVASYSASFASLDQMSGSAFFKCTLGPYRNPDGMKRTRQSKHIQFWDPQRQDILFSETYWTLALNVFDTCGRDRKLHGMEQVTWYDIQSSGRWPFSVLRQASSHTETKTSVRPDNGFSFLQIWRKWKRCNYSRTLYDRLVWIVLNFYFDEISHSSKDPHRDKSMQLGLEEVGMEPKNGFLKEKMKTPKTLWILTTYALWWDCQFLFL